MANLPPRWSEIKRGDPDYQTQLTRALVVLQSTYPNRYNNLNFAALRNKMGPRQHPSGDRFAGLRVFARTTNNVIDMVAFFFLRLWYSPEAFTMTVGTTTNDDQQLWNDITQLVSLAQNHPRIPRIEVINVNPLPGDLNDTPYAVTVGAAFGRGITAGTLNPVEDLYLGRPWPVGAYKRWLCSAP